MGKEKGEKKILLGKGNYERWPTTTLIDNVINGADRFGGSGRFSGK